jgi:hypothetical protein
MATPNDQKRLFAHLDHEETLRARLAVQLFLSVLLVALLGAWIVFKRQGDSFEEEVRHFSYHLDKLNEVKTQANDKRWLDGEAKEIFYYVYGRTPKDDSKSDRQQVEVLAKDLFSVLAADPVAQERPKAEFINSKIDLIKDRYPVLEFKTPIVFWFIFGAVYWLSIFLLYGFLLKPSRGEPIFNILDVGFIAVLVQYSGGLSSWFMLMFFFSLLLSAFDYAYEASLPEFSNQPRAKRFLILLGPYLIAVLMSLFWAVSDDVMLKHASIPSYLLSWLIFLVLAAIVWFVCFLLSQWHIERFRESSQRQAGDAGMA